MLKNIKKYESDLVINIHITYSTLYLRMLTVDLIIYDKPCKWHEFFFF